LYSRTEVLSTTLLKKMKQDTPLEIFAKWFAEAGKCKAILDRTEMCLATADKRGRPSARIVLLKNFDESGFTFFTNYNGRKSHELDENPYASLCFYWPALQKQIRIEGRVKKISARESDEYFATRASESKIGAWTSKQSEPLRSRDIFLKELEKT